MIPDLAAALLCGLIGLALGAFGGGGSILAVPVLVLVAQLTPADAVGTSLAMVGVTSLVASYAHHRRGLVKAKVALIFGGSGIVTSFLGARLTGLVPGSVVMQAFAVLMLVVGIGMLRAGGPREDAATQASAVPQAPMKAILAGAGVGLITGFLGVGGGFLVVPALMTFSALRMREAVGTSLLVIAINSAAGFLGHLGRGDLEAGPIVVLTAAAVVGALAGERVARDVSTLYLRRGFGVIVVVIGIALMLNGGARVLRSAAQGTQQLRTSSPAAARNPA